MKFHQEWQKEGPVKKSQVVPRPRLGITSQLGKYPIHLQVQELQNFPWRDNECMEDKLQPEFLPRGNENTMVITTKVKTKMGFWG